MEENYSWTILERKVPSNRIDMFTSMVGEEIPDLLIFRPKFIPDPDSAAQENPITSSKTIVTTDGTYQGHCLQGKPHGEGTMTY